MKAVVMERYGAIVGTVGVVVESRRCRMVRMAVAVSQRRSGVASALLGGAMEFAKQRGLAEIVAHTQPEWPNAVAFYRFHGFTPYGRDAFDVHLRRSLG
jgi:ribosomal protein S18 acetylase RimI-like enzyme